MPLKDSFLFFAEIIKKNLGIVYDENNQFQLEMRLLELAQSFKLTTVDELHSRALKGLSPKELQDLLDIATNNETLFFRDERLFSSLKDVIFPEILKQQSGQKIKIWSAACSSGQEPLSILMTLDSVDQFKVNSQSISLQATDISSRILERARKGLYSQFEVNRGLNKDQLAKYFTTESNGQFKVNTNLLSSIQFKELNLLSRFNWSEPFHIIFCRNVLIYQKLQEKIEIVKKIHECLVPGGYLVLGSGESLLGISTQFEVVQVGSAIFYKKI